MEVFTINKTDVRSAEKTVKKAIFAIKKNNFGDKTALRFIFFVIGVIYLFFTYGGLYSGSTPENQSILEKTEFLKNLWVKIITDTGLEHEGDYVYVFFAGFFLTLFATVILIPFIRKIFKTFYKEKKIKKDKPLYSEDWKNLVELRYKLGNAFKEYNIVNDGISAVCLYFFSSVILASVYCFNCFSFGKAIFSVLIASVTGVICYGIEVALFILADALFYDSNEKLLYLKYDLDDVWIKLAMDKQENFYLCAQHDCFFDQISVDKINAEISKTGENYDEEFVKLLSKKIEELADRRNTTERLFGLIVYLYKRKKEIEEDNAGEVEAHRIQKVSEVFKVKIDMVFYKFYDAVKENRSIDLKRV